MAVSIYTVPTVEPISVAELVDHLRLDDAADSTYLSALIVAARHHIENLTRRQLITATLIHTRDRFPPNAGPINLPRAPLQLVSTLKYRNLSGTLTELDDELYQVDAASTPGRVAPVYGGFWPTIRYQLNAVEVTYDAGYGDAASNVPQPIRHALLLLAAHWYEHREAASDGFAVQEVPMAVDALLGPYKVELYRPEE